MSNPFSLSNMENFTNVPVIMPPLAPYRAYTLTDQKLWNGNNNINCDAFCNSIMNKKDTYTIYNKSDDNGYIKWEPRINKDSYKDCYWNVMRDSFHFYTSDDILKVYSEIINKSECNILWVLKEDPNFKRRRNKQNKLVGRKTMLQRFVEINMNLAICMGFSSDNTVWIAVGGLNVFIRYQCNDERKNGTKPSIKDIKYKITNITVCPVNKIHIDFKHVVEQGLIKFDYKVYNSVNKKKIERVDFRKNENDGNKANVRVNDKDVFPNKKFTKHDQIAIRDLIKNSNKHTAFIKCCKHSKTKSYQFVRGRMTMIEYKKKKWCVFVVPGKNDQWYIDEMSVLTRIVLDKCSIGLGIMDVEEYKRIFCNRHYLDMCANAKEYCERRQQSTYYGYGSRGCRYSRVNRDNRNRRDGFNNFSNNNITTPRKPPMRRKPSSITVNEQTNVDTSSSNSPISTSDNISVDSQLINIPPSIPVSIPASFPNSVSLNLSSVPVNIPNATFNNTQAMYNITTPPSISTPAFMNTYPLNSQYALNTPQFNTTQTLNTPNVNTQACNAAIDVPHISLKEAPQFLAIDRTTNKQMTGYITSVNGLPAAIFPINSADLSATKPIDLSQYDPQFNPPPANGSFTVNTSPCNVPSGNMSCNQYLTNALSSFPTLPSCNMPSVNMSCNQWSTNATFPFSSNPTLSSCNASFTTNTSSSITTSTPSTSTSSTPSMNMSSQSSSYNNINNIYSNANMILPSPMNPCQ